MNFLAEKKKERKLPTKFPLGRQIVETNYAAFRRRWNHSRAEKSRRKWATSKSPLSPSSEQAFVAKGLKEQWASIFQVKIRRV